MWFVLYTDSTICVVNGLRIHELTERTLRVWRSLVVLLAGVFLTLRLDQFAGRATALLGEYVEIVRSNLR